MDNIYYGRRLASPNFKNRREKNNNAGNTSLFKVLFSLLIFFLFFKALSAKPVSKVEFQQISLPFVYSNYSQYESLLANAGFIPTSNSRMKEVAEVTTTNNDDNKCILVQSVPTVAVVNNKSKVDNIDSDNNVYSYVYSGEGTSTFGGNKLNSVDDVYSYLDKDKTLVGIVDAVDLRPQYRVVPIDGEYPFIDEGYDMYRDVYFCVYDDEHSYRMQNFVSILNNDNPEFLTLSQTGVTAMVRGMARKIDSVGDNKYPALLIKEYLDKSDIVHTSNEVSFMPGCNAGASGVNFCSKPEYFESMTYLGIDIVGLTGNHNNDKGNKWNTYSIEMYEEAGMKYFGGGKNIEDASKILYIEEKGTKVAFIGYNFYDWYYGYTHALAGATTAGANPYSEDKMKKDIAEAKQNADVVIVEFQFQECWAYSDSESANSACYQPINNPNQKEYFRKAVEYGADIVDGAQAHHPQIVESYEGGMIFYGLGNFFFDQEEWIGTKQGMILTHVFNEGKYLNTIVMPTYYDASFQVYVPTDSKKTDMLDIYYQR
ncbi:MAG TPA: CapA family protein [Candidatus Dojkabacteria bacterium]|nr:CapA family protein [Candidatus Dojkabacteria bacterium]HQF36381.1 CapA family protein [Candidatus Dojkabacteria bacterium]